MKCKYNLYGVHNGKDKLNFYLAISLISTYLMLFKKQNNFYT